jgi:hypothetical protein
MELPTQLGNPAGTKTKRLGHRAGSLAPQQPVDDPLVPLGSSAPPDRKFDPKELT